MRRRGVFILTLVLALGAGGVAHAAFVARTQNAGNQLATGTVSLTDDDSGAAMFAVSNLLPGDSGTRCIEVAYGGTLPPR